MVFYDRTVGFAQLVAVSGGIWKPPSGQGKHDHDKTPKREGVSKGNAPSGQLATHEAALASIEHACAVFCFYVHKRWNDDDD